MGTLGRGAVHLAALVGEKRRLGLNLVLGQGHAVLGRRIPNLMEGGPSLQLQRMMQMMPMRQALVTRDRRVDGIAPARSHPHRTPTRTCEGALFLLHYPFSFPSASLSGTLCQQSREGCGTVVVLVCRFWNNVIIIHPCCTCST